MNDLENKTMDYLKNLTVLYIEDDLTTREQFSFFLEQIVGKLIIADNGATGLKAYFDSNPHIILTDILMPAMNGLEMVKAIKKAGGTQPVIVLTAFEEADYLKQAINIGVHKYLTKPINGFQLRDTLSACAHEVEVLSTLQASACTDPLTELINRRALNQFLVAEQNRVERHGNLFSLIMVDIDNFKNINDTYTHLGGDSVLKDMAHVLLTSVRAKDICCRWGGDEFVIILPETTLQEAADVAEKFRRTLSACLINWENTVIPVTISLGVTEYSRGLSIAECVKQADDAMYHAKRKGKNRVEIFNNEAMTD